jgi:aromatic-L-amino-acid/L-tryptophan decarboxylase
VPSPLDPTPAELRALMLSATDFAATLLDELPKSNVWNPEGADALARSLAEASPTPATFPALIETLRLAASKGSNEPNPGFMGYVPLVGLPIGAVADFLDASLNRFVGLWSTAPAMVQLEWNALRWLSAALGFPGSAGGTFTSGGSIANFTALVAARHAILGSNHAPGTIYATDQLHHSNGRAVSVMGLPPGSLVHVPTDEHLRMDVEALERRITADRAAGRSPFAVIANGGTINTGAVDEISRIVDVARRQGLWVHVDGAYGGLFAVTEHGRRVLNGIGDADSVTVDPHKGMFLPAGTGCLLVRDGRILRAALADESAYLDDLRSADQGPDLADYSLELTRPFRGLRIWLALKLYGWEPFVAALNECLRLARRLDQELLADTRFELPWRPELSIVTFRLRNRSDADNLRLLEAINESGRIYVSSTVIATGGSPRATWLRACLLNHRATDATIDMALSVISTATLEI